MVILSSEQIREWDMFTISNEPVSSIDLMERAAGRCLEWLRNNDYLKKTFVIFCGKGNNGGDGLALARMLHEWTPSVKVYLLVSGQQPTKDFQINLSSLQNMAVEVLSLHPGSLYPEIPPNAVVIDGLFGSGLNRPLEGFTAGLIDHINGSGNELISIDIPSGMYPDKSSKGGAIIKASHTLSFQCYKLSFLMPENEAYFGQLHILDIGLSEKYLDTIQIDFELIEDKLINKIYQPRKAFSHKGSFGHSLIVAGSYGKIGAAVLSAKACLRTGTGLLSCIIPVCGYEIMQISIPEAMVIADSNDRFIGSITIDLSRYNAIGIGPGLGTKKETQAALRQLLVGVDYAMVVDADALNLIAQNIEMLSEIPPSSILTPHPKEFERLFGGSTNDFERLQLARQKAMETQLIIVLKGHHTVVALPGGKCYFNNTGNAGMATGGSGDVLTGIVTGLLAQGYQPSNAALLGVYLHGLAGDSAAIGQSQEALIASDIIDNLGKAFEKILRYNSNLHNS